MNEERRKAFQHRISQLLIDHQKKYGHFKSGPRDDLMARILSALEDAFQMGLRQTGVEERRESGTIVAETPEQPREIPQNPTITPARFDPEEP